MSTNWYAQGPFPGGDGEGLHIGQAEQGSTFLMRSHPALGLTSLAAWTKFLRGSDVTIVSEHGISPSVGDLRDIILKRFGLRHEPLKRRWVHGYERDGCHVDPEGVEFCAEFC